MKNRLLAALLLHALLAGAEPVQVSGIYPHLAMFNAEGECGTGAVVPWAGRLWVITYGPHLPKGSSDKLYEIGASLDQRIRPESIGGTPANRMIHAESQQLFIGPYAIDATGGVRAIAYTNMFGRHTGLARHLTDPAGRIVFATMEEGIYDVDVRTLAPTTLWADEQVKTGRKADLPGYHGKGFYAAQGRYIYANNGDHAPEARSNPNVPSGVLAEWDGRADAWRIVRRNQFTEVTGPGGIRGNPPDDDRAWSIGWDHRSLILMLLDAGRWHAYRLPKASHSYDGAHGWNTEWPRIREVGEPGQLLMTMHGSFWRFPATFSAKNSAGLTPRSSYLKVVGDFCRWGDRIVLGCDDAAKSEFLNKHPLKGALAGPDESQSNLWFIDPAQLDQCGPTLGRGAVWVREDVAAGAPSEPYLFAGYAHRGLHLAHEGDAPVTFALEVDARGDGTWTGLRTVEVPARGNVWTAFGEKETGAWIRVTARTAARAATAHFSYRGHDARQPHIMGNHFAELAVAGRDAANAGLLHAHRGRVLRYAVLDAEGRPAAAYDLNAKLELTRVDDAGAAAEIARVVAVPPPLITRDAASALYVDPNGRRWRLPGAEATKGARTAARPRTCREICTERNLLNTHGTFYELPAENAGGFAKLRPIATHNLAIHDFTSYRGLLVMSGVKKDAATTDHLVHSPDGQASLWVGAVDDLWQLGKPRGRGGPWLDTAVATGTPSDPYLMTAYDRKRVDLSHDAAEPVTMTVQVDITGNGLWVDYQAFAVEPGKALRHDFPAAFSAYWVRVVASRACKATAQFTYD
jgi:hypothetical protein